MADDCVGPEVEKLVAGILDGGVLLLENVRFYKKEEKNDPEYAKKLVSLADLYVNDAFGTPHRAHASTEGIAKYLKPSVAGYLMRKELDYLVGAVFSPNKLFAAIVGGSKVSSKIGVIVSLSGKVNILVLGGGVSLLLPSDVVIADKFATDANSNVFQLFLFHLFFHIVVPAKEIPDRWMGLDIGPDSIKSFSKTLDTTKTIIWNGPMGVFEMEKFAAGTECTKKWKLNIEDFWYELILSHVTLPDNLDWCGRAPTPFEGPFLDASHNIYDLGRFITVSPLLSIRLFVCGNGLVAAGASIQYGYISAKSAYGQVSTSFGSGLFSYGLGLINTNGISVSFLWSEGLLHSNVGISSARNKSSARNMDSDYKKVSGSSVGSVCNRESTECWCTNTWKMGHWLKMGLACHVLGEDLAASIGLLSDCEKVVPSEVVVDKDDETLVLVFDEALGVGDGVSEIKFSGVVASLQEIHSLLQEGVSADNISAKLSPWASALFEFVPPFIRKQRYGSLDELKEFDILSDDYEINWHLRSVINPTSEDLKSRSAKVKNHRSAFMDKLMYGGKFFSEDSMRDREPYLHHEFVGKFQDQSGRRMYRPGEKWSETLRRTEEALLMEKIQMEQQRLGVDEMDWVGNERLEEEQEEQEEEQEEEEDEDDEEVEEGKDGDVNVREMLSEYIDINTVLPALSSEVIHRVLEMLKYFNTRVCQLVLGAGAMQVVLDDKGNLGNKRSTEATSLSAEEIQDRMGQLTNVMQQKFLQVKIMNILITRV
ncbi:phosphoglycerate kinase, cytosolic [Tanacetum coccineum]